MFEQLLEHIVNGEEAKADALFHNIIVSKSREIYENIIESDLEDEEMDEATESDDEEEMDEATESDDEEMDEATEEDDEEMDENFGIGDEAVGGDATDDMMHDVDGPEGEEDYGDEDGDDGEEEPIDDRVDHLEDALEDLKAEFDKLMRDEEHEPEHHDGIDDPDFGDEDEDEDESMMPAFAEEVEEIDLSPAEMMREYVDKIGEPYKGGKVAGTSETNTNSKSSVAKKNDMGGTTANIAKGGTGSEKGTKGGLLDPTTKPQDGGNVNVPGAKNATKLSAVSKGHGAEKKGSGEVGGTNSKSLFK